MSVLHIHKKNLQKNEKNSVVLGDMRKLEIGLIGVLGQRKMS